MDAVAEIKRRLDIVEYIGRSVRLMRAGRSFRGLCPFHAEKTPSFYVFPDRANWRCFGSCGEGGDLFGYVQKRSGIDFSGALRELAREAGVELSPVAARRRERGEQLSRLVSTAVDYYQRLLARPEGQEARQYLLGARGLTEETVAGFHLGWAPDGWHGLRDHCAARGFEERDMVAAGLLVDPEDAGREPYDRFRGRVIFPITDERGVFVALAGRGLGAEEPKYLNSPQTEVFDKGRVLFGLHSATEAIKASGTVVVVEGYMDVLGPWQAGFRNVVATMGTSLTEGHAGLLRRLARRVVLALDPDAAGQAAAERAGELFLSLSSPDSMARSTRSAEQVVGAAALELRVAALPAGKDPDEVARGDPRAWEAAVAGAPTFPDFALRRLLRSRVSDSPAQARALIDRVKPILNAVSDPVERATYIQKVPRSLGVNEAAVLERLGSRPRARRRMEGSEPVRQLSREETLLAILLRHPSLRQHLRNLPLDLFSESVDREVFSRWLREDHHEADPDDPVAELAQRLLAFRLPPLGELEARKAAGRKVDEILRDRLIQRQAAVSEEIADAERQLGANEVAQISHDAWHGAMPPDEVSDIAQAVIEDLELGLSIHRREEPDLV